MPVFQNVEGVWKGTTEPPMVYDATTKTWTPIAAAHAHTQGGWKQIWPVVPTTTGMIHVDASGAVWPEPGTVTVTITPGPAAGVPLPGLVVIRSDEWQWAFYAKEGTATFELPRRDAGTYTVEASWSAGPVTGLDTYTIARAVPVVVLTASPPAIHFGERSSLTAGVLLGGAAAPAGGYFDVRWQSKTGGPWGSWSNDALNLEVYYEGTPETFSVGPDTTVGWQARLRDHKNLEDTTSEVCTTTVLKRMTGYLDATPTAVRSYSNGGTKMRKSQYDIYHGKYNDLGNTSTHGEELGLVWLPPLPSDKTCVTVELCWYPEHTYIDTNVDGYHDKAWMMIGCHTLITPPDTLSITNNPDVMPQLLGVPMSRDTEVPIDLSSHLVRLVNDHRNGGFGLIVGNNNSINEDWYGYGRFSRIRYIWEKWV